jgi:hypothetical protein
MNNLQLLDLIRRDIILNKMSCRIYSSDNILHCENGYLIVNTAKCGTLGKHWVVYFKNDDRDEFFDSCGKNGTYYGLESRDIFNCVNLQGKLPVCGYYCIYYCLMSCRGVSLDRIISNLSEIDENIRDLYIAYSIINNLI